MHSSLLARWVQRVDDPTPAVHDVRGSHAWREVVASADRVAVGLLAGRTTLEGERVGVLVPPSGSFVACLFGVLRAGGTAVVLSPSFAPPETRYICDDAGIRSIIASDSLAGALGSLAPARHVVSAEACAETPSSPSEDPKADPGPADPAIQLYTSGTTGKPKGAVLTHGNLAVQQELLGAAWGLSESDVLLHVLPLHHLHGLAIALLSAVGAGAAVRFLGGFEANATWDAMDRSSVFMAVPTIHAKLFSAFDGQDRATRARWEAGARALRLVTSGSAALPVTTGERWRALTGAYPLERFGMTEIGVGASNPLAAGERRPGTVGLALPTVQTCVVDDELWVAGPSVFAGYHGRSDATGEAFVLRAGERWFKTGDTVAQDERGYIRILGRTSVDILKSGGYKVSALEIEEVLREHPVVADVAVVGIPDATWGDRVVACVVARQGQEAACDEDTLRGFARERLSPYKVPKRVVVMPALPRNALGKVIKRELVRILTQSGG
jgi:malonyl-CoA/methylmalonyl-CoA synthetase